MTTTGSNSIIFGSNLKITIFFTSPISKSFDIEEKPTALASSVNDEISEGNSNWKNPLSPVADPIFSLTTIMFISDKGS